ncbi:MAG: hypothetical protein M3O20_13720 [Acidobacteriota bacterium]|nr:hypothetical protein [Acidobacteriota bacterium]
MSIAGVILPTNFRHLSAAEWSIVNTVFGPTLPFQFRVFVADGIGLHNVPFTVPTSVISSALLAAGIANPLLPALAPRIPLALAAGYGASIGNAGFVMNVGPKYYPDLTITAWGKDLLVHEMTHVWQGKNSVFALSATLGALAAQCMGMSTSGGFSGRTGAYAYKISSPLAAWGSFNPEQQAQIVEDWYHRGASKADDVFPYIGGYVRKGKTG